MFRQTKIQTINSRQEPRENTPETANTGVKAWVTHKRTLNLKISWVQSNPCQETSATPRNMSDPNHNKYSASLHQIPCIKTHRNWLLSWGLWQLRCQRTWAGDKHRPPAQVSQGSQCQYMGAVNAVATGREMLMRRTADRTARAKSDNDDRALPVSTCASLCTNATHRHLEATASNNVRGHVLASQICTGEGGTIAAQSRNKSLETSSHNLSPVLG